MSIFSNKKNRNAFLPMSFTPTYKAAPQIQSNLPTFNHGFNKSSPFGSQKTWQQTSNFPSKTSSFPSSPLIGSNVALFNGPINWRNCFKSNSKPSKIIEQMKIFLESENIRDFVIDYRKCKIEGRYFSANHELAEFLIQVFNVKEQSVDEEIIVQINRLKGDANTFHSFYTQLVNTLNENGFISYTTIQPKSLNKNNICSFEIPTFDLEFQFTNDSFVNSDDQSEVIEMIDMMETGFHDEVQSAAIELAGKSSQTQTIQKLSNIPNAAERLLALCLTSIDVVLVRCILIILTNGLIEAAKCQENITKDLATMKLKWSKTQKMFDFQVEIRSSLEITTKIDSLMLNI